MSICQSIAKSLGGQLTYIESEGLGSHFMLQIKAVELKDLNAPKFLKKEDPKQKSSEQINLLNNVD